MESRKPESGANRSNRIVAHELITTYSWTPAEAYRTKSYWLIVAAGITCQYPLFFFVAHWILHARGAGILASDAAWTMSSFAIGGIVGRLIGGWLMDTITGRYAFMIGFCLFIIGSFLALEVNASALAIAFAAAIFVRSGFRLDIHLHEHVHGALLRHRRFSQVKWNDDLADLGASPRRPDLSAGKSSTITAATRAPSN